MDDLFMSEVPILKKTIQIHDTQITYTCVHPENCQIAKYVPLVNWNTDNALISYFPIFLKNSQKIPRNSSLLELGSGLGIPSIFVAKNFKFKEIAINDGDQNSIEFINRNVDLNHPYLTKQIDILNFWWFDNEQILKEKDSSNFKFKGKFDLIMGSDVIYNKETVKLLLFTIKWFLSETGKCILSNFYSRFFKNEDEFTKISSDIGLNWNMEKVGQNNETVLCFLEHK